MLSEEESAEIEEKIARGKLAFYEKIKSYVEPHLDTLTIKRDQLVYINDYGVEETSKWAMELGEFMRNIVLPKQAAASRSSVYKLSRKNDPDLNSFLFEVRFTPSPVPLKKASTRLIEVFDKAIAEHKAASSSSTAEWVSTNDPRDYEQDCCRQIRRLGWNARVTGRSGDQGVDILASFANLRVALQCKLYHSQPVGNAAVQEVKAGAAYVQAGLSAVISNAEYTPSARRLASSLGVDLIHHTQLRSYLENLLEQHEPDATGRITERSETTDPSH